MAENDNHFHSGILIGSLLGAGAVFLFGTKKGKKLLKTLTEEGLDSVTELAGIIDDELGNPSKTVKKIEKKAVHAVENIRELEPVQQAVERLEPAAAEVKKETGIVARQVEKSAKRLFKNVPKKLKG